MVKIWDDPQVNVDDLIVEFLERYFGPAGEPTIWDWMTRSRQLAPRVESWRYYQTRNVRAPGPVFSNGPGVG